MQQKKSNDNLKQRGITNKTEGHITGIVIQKNQVVRMSKLAAKRRRVKRIE